MQFGVECEWTGEGHVLEEQVHLMLYYLVAAINRFGNLKRQVSNSRLPKDVPSISGLSSEAVHQIHHSCCSLASQRKRRMEWKRRREQRRLTSSLRALETRLYPSSSTSFLFAKGIELVKVGGCASPASTCGTSQMQKGPSAHGPRQPVTSLVPRKLCSMENGSDKVLFLYYLQKVGFV